MINVDTPQNKSEKRIFRNYLNLSSRESPIVFYIGSCPDYSNKDGLYTHEDVGEGVPLLTRTHLENDQELFGLLNSFGIPYKVKIMIADVEAIDDVFAERFTGGDENEFLRKCVCSMDETQKLIEMANLGKQFVSTSFFTEFGYNNFMNYQNSYSQLLMERYGSDSSFRTRVDSDIYARSEMYHKMYPDSLIKVKGHHERHLFLVGRDIRTKSQYLTLGRLISEKENELPVIINHPTKNIGMFNDRNKYLLPEDGVHPQKTIPILEMKKKVY